MVRLAVEALDEKKGEDIKIIDIQGVTVIADYFVLASASNSSQTQALIDNCYTLVEHHKSGVATD